MQATRWAGPVAGLGFVAAVLVEGIAFPGGANSSDPPPAIADYYQQHGTADLVVDHLSLVAVPLLLLFLLSATTRLRGTAARFARAAAVAGAGFDTTATAVEVTLAAAVGRLAPATTTAALFDVSSRLFLASLLWLGLCVGTIALCDHGRAWARVLGGVAAAALVGAGFAMAHPHGALGVLVLPAEGLLGIWVVATAVLALRSRGPLPVERRRPVAA